MLRGQESPLWCSAAVTQDQSKDSYDTYSVYPTVNGNEESLLSAASGQPTPPYRTDTSPGQQLNAYSQITYQTQNRSPELQMLETVKPGQLVMQQTLKEVDFTWDAPMPDDALNYVPKPTLNELQPRSRHNTLTLNQQDSFDSNNSEEEFFNQPTHDRRAVSFGGTSQFARRFNRHNTYNPNLLVVRSQSGSLYDSSENLGAGPNSATIVGSPDTTGFSPGMASPTGYGGGVAPSSGASDTSDPGQPQGKKSATRRNAWGSMSYADLITQAIMQSPEKRLTLAQVYEWMVQNVPYFRDKGDSNSSAGWKNSIRHNLSLHSRFMRIQNEGAGKSSWWVINPDAKPGRNPRRTRDRAATADSKTIGNLKETRRKARNRVKDIRAMMGGSVSSSQVSISSHEPLFADDPNFPPMFRDRANSALTNPTSRVSPSMEGFNDFDFPPWVDASAPPQIPADLVDRTQDIRLEGCIDTNSPAFRRTLLNGINGEHKEMKTAKLEIQDPPMMQTAPPSYHELNAVRSQNQQMQNPLLRNAPLGQLPKQGGPYGFSPYSSWNMSPGMSLPTTQSCASQQVASMGSLPVDLENLTLPDQPLMEMDMEAVLRHELSQTTNNQLNFDI